MVAVPPIERMKRMTKPGSRPCGPRSCLLALHRRLREVVTSKLILEWSPEQVSGWLKTEYPNDERMRVSHETIYRSLFIQARGVLKKELMGHLRTKRRMRRSQHSRIFKDSRGQIADAISIRERPAEVEDRAVPGHWEGDLLSGSRNSHIVTLVERHSRFAHADQSAQQGHGRGGDGIESACSQTSGYPATLVDVGSRTGDGEAQGLYGSYRCAGLLLRSAKSLAAWHERKHEPAVDGNTSREEPTCLAIRKRISTKSRYA